MVHFLEGNCLLGEVVAGKIDYYFFNFCRFLAIFSHFYSFWCIFIAVGAFLAIFPIFLGFVGIFWGTPANYFADFGAILDHF